MKYLLLICSVPLTMMMAVNKCNTPSTSTNDEAMDLEYLMRQPASANGPAPLLILLHGYGSNEKDLFSIAQRVPEDWFVVSVRAPFAMSSNQYKWFDGAIKGDEVVIDLVTEKQGREALLQFIDQFVAEHEVDKEKVVTAGFSQGAAVGLTIAMTDPDKVYAAACFSGRVMEPIQPLIKGSNTLKHKPVFMAYGTADRRTSVATAEENVRWMESFGMKVSFNTYDMGHSIVPQEIADFVLWLEGI